ncbi:MAG: helix-hairpin-helix domain-containing protein [Candidatus Zixiibacteriota bacterium]
MGRLADFFQFSTAQLRFLIVLSATALVMTLYLLIRSLASPTPEALAMPVFLGDEDTEYTGVFVLDPNTAPVDSLELLPGIGRVLADRIVEYRQKHRFVRTVDLTEVKGIGPRLLEQLRPYIRISNP